jgi:hypothetical protein
MENPGEEEAGGERLVPQETAVSRPAPAPSIANVTPTIFLTVTKAVSCPPRLACRR